MTLRAATRDESGANLRPAQGRLGSLPHWRCAFFEGLGLPAAAGPAPQPTGENFSNEY